MHHVHMNPDELRNRNVSTVRLSGRYGSQNSIVCQVNDSEFIHSNIGATTCMLETWQQVYGRPARESTPLIRGDHSPYRPPRP